MRHKQYGENWGILKQWMGIWSYREGPIYKLSPPREDKVGPSLNRKRSRHESIAIWSE